MTALDHTDQDRRRLPPARLPGVAPAASRTSGRWFGGCATTLQYDPLLRGEVTIEVVAWDSRRPACPWWRR